ncbi:MAG: peroxiredoxin [Cyclobacteriaceae bacterium]|nr:peroxiredoxin [Cyclobacteriaceae bacterium]
MKKIGVGDTLPVFCLYNQDGKLIDIGLLIGRPLVIYFYPKDDTPGCSRQACSFRDEYHQFTDAGVKVFGISADGIDAHKNFKEKYRLPFDLLSDIENKVRKLLGVPSDLFGFIPGRVTYVIDRKGIVKHIFNNQINATKHVEESLRMIAEI